MNDLINITNRNGNLVVSSREIAKNFEKRHDNVLKDIDDLIKGAPQKLGYLFIKSEYVKDKLSTIKYAEKFGHIDNLYKIALKLYETDINEILKHLQKIA